jgi:hypothetical protein
MSTHLVIDTIIYYFRDTSYISGINDIFPEVMIGARVLSMSDDQVQKCIHIERYFEPPNWSG